MTRIVPIVFFVLVGVVYYAETRLLFLWATRKRRTGQARSPDSQARPRSRCTRWRQWGWRASHGPISPSRTALR